jgi:hypothetical protein
MMIQIDEAILGLIILGSVFLGAIIGGYASWKDAERYFRKDKG